VKDQISHPNKTTGKIMVLYTLIFVFRGETGRQKLLNKMPANNLHI